MNDTPTPFDRRLLLGAAGLAGIAALASRPAAAGPLDPPPGGIGSTAKPIGEIEPRTAINAANTPGDGGSVFRVSQPGSYYLTANLAVPFNKTGIKIDADNVTIDLQGFTISAVSGSSAGIGATAAISGTTVRNGRLAGPFFNSAVALLSDTSAINTLIENLVIVGGRGNGNSGSGIMCGDNYVIRGCLITNTGAYGIVARSHGLVDSCVVHNCVAWGMQLSSNATVRNCTANDCQIGIGVGTFCVVTGCSVSGNTGVGISLNESCLVTDNYCHATGTGIDAFSGNHRLDGNTCTNSAFGIHVQGTRSIIVCNVCQGNGTDWVITANNVVGPILDRRSPAGAAINGFSAPSSLGSTDPNANFSL